MEEMNIYTLLTIIRGFSNEITVRALADKLSISYSTLARCKNGAWPRSITRDAMRAVIEECRDRFFDGSDEALARSVLLQLNGKGIDTAPLERIVEKQNYSEFVSDLLAYAEDSAAYLLTHTCDSEAVQIEPSRLTTEVFFAIPIAIVLLVGLFNVSLASMFDWASTHRAVFIGISVLIALLPTLFGLLIDAPLAWHAYRQEHRDATFTLHAFSRVARFGDTQGVSSGAGRFNLSWEYFVYQPLCNLLGMMCYVALFLFELTLPGFDSFFVDHEWSEFFKVGIVVAYFVACSHMRAQSKAVSKPEQTPDLADNPDNYLPTRVHIWANTAHLVWTISLLIVLLLGLIAYSIVQARSIETPLLMLWPYLCSMAFYFHACASPLAIRLHAKSVGVLFPGVLATSAGFTLLTVMCYLPSIGAAAMCTSCAAFSFAAYAWARVMSKDEDAVWFREGQKTGTYSVAIATSILVLLIIGFATSAF